MNLNLSLFWQHLFSLKFNVSFSATPQIFITVLWGMNRKESLYEPIDAWPVWKDHIWIYVVYNGWLGTRTILDSVWLILKYQRRVRGYDLVQFYDQWVKNKVAKNVCKLSLNRYLQKKKVKWKRDAEDCWVNIVVHTCNTSPLSVHTINNLLCLFSIIRSFIISQNCDRNESCVRIYWPLTFSSLLT